MDVLILERILLSLGVGINHPVHWASSTNNQQQMATRGYGLSSSTWGDKWILIKVLAYFGSAVKFPLGSLFLLLPWSVFKTRGLGDGGWKYEKWPISTVLLLLLLNEQFYFSLASAYPKIPWWFIEPDPLCPRCFPPLHHSLYPSWTCPRRTQVPLFVYHNHNYNND